MITRSWLILFLALALPTFMRSQSASEPPAGQNHNSGEVAGVAIPWVKTPPDLGCASADWKATSVVLSRATGKLVSLNPSDVQDLPGELEPANVVAAVPAELQSQLDSRRTFHFAWAEKNLYAWVVGWRESGS
jgi:hypothetical protein